MTWQARLQSNYTNFAEFQYYSDVYCLAERLGYASARLLWDSNPVVTGSTNPADFRKVV
jgi:hypothetical protein